MNSIQTSTLSKEKYTFNILDSIRIDIEITENPYQLPIEELFTMAARVNKKRSFLFVSKVLGKHIPINPDKGLITAAMLASRFIETVKGRECSVKEELLSAFFMNEPAFTSCPFIRKESAPIIIGFAETATALAHGFFDCFLQADYFHTTREEVDGLTPEIIFEEEHSHATAHLCYIPKSLLQNESEIILVDDEITTGKTALNIIQALHSKSPRKVYTVVSILDWRSKEHKSEFFKLEKQLGITINVVSLIAGEVQVQEQRKIDFYKVETVEPQTGHSTVEQLNLSAIFEPAFQEQKKSAYIFETGRFGLSSQSKKEIDEKVSYTARLLKQNRIGNKTLCLGSGEFMYLPMKIASEMGQGIYYQSTTRSPIYIENAGHYSVRYGLTFASPEDPFTTLFVYNIPPDCYDEVFCFFERKQDLNYYQPLLKELEKLLFKSIKLVFFSEERSL